MSRSCGRGYLEPESGVPSKLSEGLIVESNMDRLDENEMLARQKCTAFFSRVGEYTMNSECLAIATWYDGTKTGAIRGSFTAKEQQQSRRGKANDIWRVQALITGGLASDANPFCNGIDAQ